MALAAAAGLALPVLSAPLEARIEVNREQIYLGESFILYLRVQGRDDPALRPDLSALPEAEIRALGSQSASSRRIRIVNGRMHSEATLGRTFAFEVRPARPGTFAAGPIRLESDGTEIRVSGPDVRVIGLNDQDQVRIEIRASRETVYVSQPFTLTLDIAVRALPPPHSDIEPLPPADPPRLEAPLFAIEDRPRGLEGPDIKSVLQKLLAGNRRDPGFRINEYTLRNNPFSNPFAFDFDMFDRPQAAKFRIPPVRRRHDGAEWWHYRLDFEYKATLENDYVFGPLTFKGNIWTGANPDNTPRGEPVFAVGPAATVRVVPPPENGRPDSFIGAIGNDMRVEAALDTQTCRMGDPLILTLDITGEVSRENMRPPTLSLQTNLLNRFRIYDDTVQTESLPRGKRFKYRVRPLRAGSYELPPIEAAYFDPTTEEYYVVRSDPLPLHVREGPQVSLPERETGDSTTPPGGQAVQGHGLSELPSGILVGKLPRTDLPSPFLLSVGWGVGPVLFFVVLFSDRIRHRHRREGLRRARRRAARTALRTLKRASSLSAPEIQACLSAYFQDRWGIPPGRITPEEIMPALVEAGSPETTASAWPPILEALSRQAFAEPGGQRPETGDTFASVGNLVAAMEQTAASPPGLPGRLLRVGGILGIAIGLILALSAGILRNRNPDESLSQRELEFLWRRGNTLLAEAASPAAFRNALDAYRELAFRGVRSTPLFYNMGVAAFLAEDPEGALEAFRRAERLGGAVPGLRHNLRLARSAAAEQPLLDLPAYRIPLFWHFDFSLAQRLVFLTIFWNLLWLAPVLFGRHGAGEGMMGLCLLLCLLAGASVATSLCQESRCPPSMYGEAAS